MIKLIGNLPDKVLAITATGHVTSDDYRTVVTPAVNSKRAVHSTLRLLYHVPPEFKKFTTTALWDDAQIGLHCLHDFERVAIATDVDWLRIMASELQPENSAKIRVFAHSELDKAHDWICA
jgi:hypothetical protein